VNRLLQESLRSECNSRNALRIKDRHTQIFVSNKTQPQIVRVICWDYLGVATERFPCKELRWCHNIHRASIHLITYIEICSPEASKITGFANFLKSQLIENRPQSVTLMTILRWRGSTSTSLYTSRCSSDYIIISRELREASV